MLLRNFIPSPHLREYVRFFGIVHFLFPKGIPIPVKPYSPRPETSIYFFPKGSEYITYPGNNIKVKQSPIVVNGQHTLMNYRHCSREFLGFIVHFQPGVFYRLTGIPTHELTNTSVDGELVFPNEIKFINEQLGNCRSYPEMIAVVETYLTKLIHRSRKDVHGIDSAAKLLLQHPGHISMDWLAKESCLCSRQFERKFKERTGVTASVLARIVRFDRTVKMKNANPDKDWLSIAIQCGYHDYQHMVRDYKDFTGLTPTAYFQVDLKAPESIFGLHEESRVYQV